MLIKNDQRRAVNPIQNYLNHLKPDSHASIPKLDPVALHHTASTFLALLKIR
jgi:hypothetical protein